MDDEARRARNDYLKKWRAKNPERVKKYNADYWRRKAKQMAEQADKGGERDEN